jgi:hypothetical protein
MISLPGRPQVVYSPVMLQPILLQPTLHKPIPLGSKVRVVTQPGDPVLTGEVVGISSLYVIFNYIILLDEPVRDGYGTHRAVCYPGTLLEGLDGTSWKLDG